MPIEFHRDGPWELPEGWMWAPLRLFLQERGESVDPSRSPKTEFTLYSVPSFESGAPEVVLGETIGSSKQRVSTGEVLLCKINPRINRSWIVGSHRSSDVVASTEWIVLNGQGVTEPTYLQWLLRQERVRIFLASNVSGVGGSLMRVKGSTIADFPVPIAPLGEQRRIVARIDELFTEIADGEASLARARADLDTWRRALLKAAVTGELTREWRETHRPNESGSAFINRICVARPSPLKSVTGILDESDLAALPDEWAWATLPNLCVSDQRNGISIKGTPDPPGVKALRLDALTASGLDLSACRYIPLKEERIGAYKVNAHDFLISRANGSAAFVGRGVYVPAVSEEFVFPDTIIRYPLFPSEILGSWLQLAWSSPFTRQQIIAKAKTSAGILKISQDDIAQVAVPVPPEVEMMQLIKTIQSNSEAVEATRYIEDSEKDGGKLRQSILKAAFEGRLVAQDPRDEPAERLLARLGELPSADASSRRRPTTRRAARAAE